MIFKNNNLIVVILLLSVCFAGQKIKDTSKKDIFDVRFLEGNIRSVWTGDYSIQALKKFNSYTVQTVPQSRYFLLLNSNIATYCEVSYPIKNIICGAPDLYNIVWAKGDKSLIAYPKNETAEKHQIFTNLTILFENGESLMLVLVPVNNMDEATFICKFVDSNIDKNLSRETQVSLKQQLQEIEQEKEYYVRLLSELTAKNYYSVDVHNVVNFNNVNYRLESIIDAYQHLVFLVNIDSSQNDFDPKQIKLNIQNQLAFLFYKTKTSEKQIEPERIIKTVSLSGIRYLIMFNKVGISTLFKYDLILGQNLNIAGEVEIDQLKDLANEVF